MANTIQQRFSQLFQITSALFTAQYSSSKEEQVSLDAARAAALALASQARQPGFDRFLAYLLGVTSLDGDYPLQAIRMLCVTAQVLTRQPPTSNVNLDDLHTAAFVADLGFRSAWIGQKGSHAEVAAYRVKGIGFSWFNQSVEKLIMAHHNFPADASPQHCLSLVSRFLALVYGGLGTDDMSIGRLSPAKALETLLQEHPTAIANIKFMLKSISAFPLGSWVLLNNGEPALVIGTNPDNPLRPTIGYCRKSKNGTWEWEEHYLQNQPTIHISTDLAPSPIQQSFVNHPHLWIKGWDGQGAFSDAEYNEVFARVINYKDSEKVALPGSPSTEPLWLSKSPAPVAGLEHPASGASTPNISDKELQKLRTDWETNVHHIEECVTKLKTGLIESYRRENERYREALEHLAKNSPAAPTPSLSSGVSHHEPAPVPPGISQTLETGSLPSSALLNSMQGRLLHIQSELEARENQFKDQNNNLQESLSVVKAFFEKGLSKAGQGPADQASAVHKVITKALAEIHSAEQDLLQALRLPMASLNELRVQWESAKSSSDKFQLELLQGTDRQSIEERYTPQWKEALEPQLDKWRETVDRDWMERQERWARLKQLIEQFQELAELVKTKFPELN